MLFAVAATTLLPGGVVVVDDEFPRGGDESVGEPTINV